MARSVELQKFLAVSAESLAAATAGAAQEASLRITALFEAEPGVESRAMGERLPACQWVEPALAAGALAGYHPDLRAAFAAISERLVWRRRATADPEDTAFWEGHANALILGPGGLEERSDVWVGVTVMAPGVTYVDHDHPPEEVYLPLAPGEWWNAEMDWTDPGARGAIYNPPGILHAMRAGDGPFLALWYLPI